MKVGKKYCSRKCFHIAGNKAFKWTDEEKLILRQHFSDSSKSEIMALIPRKSYGSIYRLSSTYGLRKSKLGLEKSYNDRTIRHGHEINIDKKSKKRAPRKKRLRLGYNPWNKGLTKEDDIRIKKLSEDRMGDKNPVHNPGVSEKISNTLTGRFIGELNPAWIDGRSFDSYPPSWTDKLKKLIKERDSFRCQICKKSEVLLYIHHIDYNKKNCNPDNLITLCNSCHAKTSWNRESWKEVLIKKMEERNILLKGALND